MEKQSEGMSLSIEFQKLALDDFKVKLFTFSIHQLLGIIR